MQRATVEHILGQFEGATFCGLDQKTVVKLTGGKKNEMQGRVEKVTLGSTIMLFTNKRSNAYDNMVKRRLEQEGKDPESFVLKPRKWGDRIPNTPFIEHKGEMYLDVIYHKAGKTHYLLDGQPIDKTDIIGLPEDRVDHKQQAGLNNQVKVRTLKMESIVAIRYNGQEYH